MTLRTEQKQKSWGHLFSFLWAVACLGIVALNSWMLIEDNRKVVELKQISEALMEAPYSDLNNALMAELGRIEEIQKRAALPLAVNLPELSAKLAGELETMAQGVDSLISELATEFPEETLPEVPTVMFTHFKLYPHVLIFTHARAFSQEPRYFFRKEYSQGPFLAEHFESLRKGDKVDGWTVRGAYSSKQRGRVIERLATDRRGKQKEIREKLPDFEVYRLELYQDGSGSSVLTIPRSDRDEVKAELSGFQFEDKLPGRTPVAWISIHGYRDEPEKFEVKQGCEFLALGKKYRVLSVSSTALRLRELQTQTDTVWERGRFYE